MVCYVLLGVFRWDIRGEGLSQRLHILKLEATWEPCVQAGEAQNALVRNIVI